MDHLNEILEQPFVGDTTIGNVAAFATTIFVGLLLARLVTWFFRGKLLDWAGRSRIRVDEEVLLSLERPMSLFILGVAARASIEFLKLSDTLDLVLANIITVVLTVFVAWGLSRCMDAVRITFIDPRVAASETKLDDQLVPIVDRTLKVVLWSLAILIAFSNLGYDILSLLTGLGIGGLAVAMAAQATLSNLLGSVTIFADQPFQVDDYIEVAGHLGVVTDVGLRASRIRTIEGYVVNIPNATVVDQPVVNHTIDKSWRHDIKIGLVYDTPYDKLEEAMRIIESICEVHPRVEDWVVRFTDFADSALVISAAFFVPDGDIPSFLDTQSEVNLEIKRQFDEAGLSMAFPSMSVYVESMPVRR